MMENAINSDALNIHLEETICMCSLDVFDTYVYTNVNKQHKKNLST